MTEIAVAVLAALAGLVAGYLLAGGRSYPIGELEAVMIRREDPSIDKATSALAMATLSANARVLGMEFFILDSEVELKVRRRKRRRHSNGRRLT